MKFCLSLVVGVLLIDVLWAQVDPKACLKAPDGLCKPKNLGEFENRDKTYPDEAMLNQFCDEFVRAFKCLVDFEKACLPEGESLYGTGRNSVGAGYNFVKNLCDKETSIGKGYRKHVDCLNTEADNIKMCFQNSSILGDRFKEHMFGENNNMTNEEKDQVECIVIIMSKACSEDTIKNSCGQEASGTAMEIYNLIPNVLDSSLCSAENLVQVGERFAAFLVQEAEESRKK